MAVTMAHQHVTVAEIALVNVQDHAPRHVPALAALAAEVVLTAVLAFAVGGVANLVHTIALDLADHVEEDVVIVSKYA